MKTLKKIHKALIYIQDQIIDFVFQWSVLGYCLIFISIEIFGKTNFLGLESFAQIVMIAVGGIFIKVDDN